MRISSLQSRIILFHLLAIVLATIAVPLANYLVINRSANLFEARILRSHAEQIAGYLKKDGQGQWRLALPPDLSALYGQGLEGLSYAVRGQDRRLMVISGKDSDAALVAPRPSLSQMSRDGAQVYAVSVDHDGLSVTVAQNAQYPDVIFDDIMADYLSRIGWFTVAILAILLAVDIVIIRRALHPVVRASRIASAIDPKRTDLRLPLAGLPRELLPLIVAVNEALDRLEKGMRLQQEFTADAAHELRTPLAILRARLETITDGRLKRELHDDIDSMSRIINQLLEVAELDAVVITQSEQTDLTSVGSEVVQAMAPLAVRQNRSVALTAAPEPVWVRGNAEMIRRAIRNLVENALRHTPPGTTVEVNVGRDGSLFVSDEGPGVPAAERELIFQRFWRRDRRRSGGAGLGLAIVRRIVDAHSGSIAVTNGAAGGAVFRIQLNLARP
jgi:signal transduction histidine kinase